MSQKLNLGSLAGYEISKSNGGLPVARQKLSIGSIWTMEHWRKNHLLNKLVTENVVTDEFINHNLDAVLSGGTQITSWYVCIFSDNYTPVATDTYASPGYTEATGYDETSRPQWLDGGVSNKSITNESNKATFTMDGTNTDIYGCSLVSVATKGDTAGGGILGPSALFDSAITGILDDDIVKVYVTVTGSDV